VTRARRITDRDRVAERLLSHARESGVFRLGALDESHGRWSKNHPLACRTGHCPVCSPGPSHSLAVKEFDAARQIEEES
jgi:hypothetical protein